MPYNKGRRGCVASVEGGAVVQCSRASVTRNGLDLSGSRTKRAASHLICCVNLQASRSLNAPACSTTWLSQRADNMPSCIVSSFQPCKVRPSQELQSVPSEGGRGRDSGKHMPRHAEVA